MKINKLIIHNIRNLEKEELNFEKNNLILGNNGTGKTTIAEVIHYCCFFKSFRTNRYKDFLKKNTEKSTIKIYFESKNEQNEININFFNNQKKIFLNGKEINNYLDVLTKLNLVVITPSTIDIIDTTPKNRRLILDKTLSQLDNKYLINIIKYNKLLKIKNKILKENIIKNNLNLNLLKILTKDLNDLNEILIEKRKKLLIKLEIYINNKLKNITNNQEVVKIEYLSKNKQEQEQEIKYGKTLSGIQLDDYVIKMNNYESKKYSSQGQKKLITILFYLAQNELFKIINNQNPILIFDDIHLDIDNNRQKKMFNLLEKDNQIFYITTNHEKMNFLNTDLKKYNIIKMK